MKPFITAQNKGAKTYKLLTFLSVLYFLFFLLPSFFLHKVISLPVIGVIPVSILTTGFYFVTLDIITEVYGYYEGRKVLFSVLAVYAVYVCVVSGVTSLHSPPVQHHLSWDNVHSPHAYEYVFGNLYLFGVSVVVCGLLGNTLNILALSKWKVMLKGRYFWLRSVTSSTISAAFYSFVSMFIVMIPFLHQIQLGMLLKLMCMSFVSKIITISILSYPATFVCSLLKYIEGVDVYSEGLTFNPFKAEEVEPLPPVFPDEVG